RLPSLTLPRDRSKSFDQLLAKSVLPLLGVLRLRRRQKQDAVVDHVGGEQRFEIGDARGGYRAMARSFERARARGAERALASEDDETEAFVAGGRGALRARRHGSPRDLVAIGKIYPFRGPGVCSERIEVLKGDTLDIEKGAPAFVEHDDRRLRDAG